MSYIDCDCKTNFYCSKQFLNVNNWQVSQALTKS